MKVFLSAPISSSVSKHSIILKDSIVDLKMNLLQIPAIDKVFYAGEGMRSKSDFDSPVAAFNEDISELLTSDIFLLIYPERLPTSAIFEAGVAYSNNKKLFFYYHRLISLPYLLHGIENAHIKAYDEFSEILDDFRGFIEK